MTITYTIIGKCLVASAAIYLGIFAFWFMSISSCQSNYGGSCGEDNLSKIAQVIYPI